MTFEEWYEEHKYDYGRNSRKLYAQDAWNAAIDEAVKVADKHIEYNMDDGGYYNNAANAISDEIEELKE